MDACGYNITGIKKIATFNDHSQWKNMYAIVVWSEIKKSVVHVIGIPL